MNKSEGRRLCTIYFDHCMYQQAKLYCFKIDKTFSEFVRSAVSMHLKKNLKKEADRNAPRSKTVTN